MKIVIAEPINEVFTKLLKTKSKEWVTYDDSPKDKKELIERLKDAEVSSSYSIKYDEEIFKACPKLKFLAIPAVGANFFVDMEAAEKYGVTVMNCPGYNANAVAELAIGLAIMVARKVPKQQHELRNGLWQDSHGFQISNKNIGIIGNGNVSKAIQNLLSSWSVDISVVDSKSTSLEVDDIFSNNQVIFICCPLTESTKNLVNADRIASMSQDSIIINVGRGAVIDQDALLKALKEKKIYGAGLDVFVDEPEYDKEVSKEINEFYKLNNVLVTPHVAGNSIESSEKLAEMIYKNLRSAEDGKPINIYK